MHEENNPGTGLGIVESEMELRKWRIIEENTLVRKINPVTMTDIITITGNNLESEIPIFRQDNQLPDNFDLPMESFLSLNSEQSNEREEGESITSTTNWVKILKFEDVLTDEDHRQFEIRYESLLLDGKVGNLTKSTLEVVLAQKPPAWLQVIHERLKLLIISLEFFPDRRKGGYKIKRKIKPYRRDRLWGNKKQKELHIGDSSNRWLKEKLTKNSIIGIPDSWFCW